MPFRLSRPADQTIRRFIAAQQSMPFSYPEIGTSITADSAAGAPPGYTVDHNRIKLGVGEEAFARAVAAVRNWKMFEIGWVHLCSPSTPIQSGAVVAVAVSHLGFWSLNACRILYTFDKENGGRKFGFAYGTLADHAECGEERFSVEWHRDDDSVWYDLFAFSRPNHFLARAAYPVSRMLQRRFARDSKLAMLAATR